METQEIFNTVAVHLFRQGHRAMNGSACVYRAPNGDKCAVGALISDEDYSQSFECSPIGIIARDLPGWFEENVSLLVELQTIHDFPGNWFCNDKMKKQFRWVAAKYKLDASILDSLSFTRNEIVPETEKGESVMELSPVESVDSDLLVTSI